MEKQEIQGWHMRPPPPFTGGSKLGEYKRGVMTVYRTVPSPALGPLWPSARRDASLSPSRGQQATRWELKGGGEFPLEVNSRKLILCFANQGETGMQFLLRLRARGFVSPHPEILDALCGHLEMIPWEWEVPRVLPGGGPFMGPETPCVFFLGQTYVCPKDGALFGRCLKHLGSGALPHLQGPYSRKSMDGRWETSVHPLNAPWDSLSPVAVFD